MNEVKLDNLGNIEETVKEYRQFAFRGDLLKLVAAFIIATSLTNFVNVISGGIFMPFLNYVVFHTAGGNWQSFTWAPTHGLTLEIGKVVRGAFDLFSISIIFFILVKALGRLDDDHNHQPPPLPTKKKKRKNDRI